MKIIEDKYSDDLFPKRTECWHCGSVLEVEKDDCITLCDNLSIVFQYKFQCPCCGAYNVIDI